MTSYNGSNESYEYRVTCQIFIKCQFCFNARIHSLHLQFILGIAQKPILLNSQSIEFLLLLKYQLTFMVYRKQLVSRASGFVSTQYCKQLVLGVVSIVSSWYCEQLVSQAVGIASSLFHKQLLVLAAGIERSFIASRLDCKQLVSQAHSKKFDAFSSLTHV